MWYHAIQLHDKADTLAEQVSGNPALTGPVNDLKEAIGASETEGLQKALRDLKDARDSAQIVEKAQEAISKFNAVASAYDKVKEKQSEYESVLGSSEFSTKYTQVTSAFTALKQKFNDAKCKVITPIHDKPWMG